MSELMSPSEYIERCFAANGLSLSREQTAAFLTYVDLLRQKNTVMNLTAITDFADIVHKHFLDSCAIALFPSLLPEKRAIRLIDVGSGAGFPGIPLKILYPEMNVVLLDSLKKRVGFLEEVIAALGLEDITAVHARAEDGARRGELRESFDLAVSRAVAALPVLAEYCLPFVRRGGRMIAYKGGESAAEAEAAGGALSLLGGGKPEVTVYTIPGADGVGMGRSLIRVEKIGSTPKKYPRKAGTASKLPLS